MKKRWLNEAGLPPRPIERAVKLGNYLTKRQANPRGRRISFIPKFNPDHNYDVSDRADREARQKLGIKNYSSLFNTHGKLVKLPTHKLLPTQDDTDWEENFYRDTKSKDTRPIHVVKADGNYMIWDGHHRWIDAKLKREPEVNAFLLDTDAILKEEREQRSVERAARLGEYLARRQQKRYDKEMGGRREAFHQPNKTIYFNNVVNPDKFQEMFSEYDRRKLYMHPTHGYTHHTEVSPQDLTPMQPHTYFTREYYKDIKSKDKDPIEVMKKGSTLVITNGHHRWLGAKLRRDKKVPIVYADLGEETIIDEERSIDRAARLGEYLARRHNKKSDPDVHDPWHHENETIYLDKHNENDFKNVHNAYVKRKLHMHPTGGFTRPMRVSPKDLIPTQHITYFNQAYYKKKKANDPRSINVVKKDGKLYIADGHHRWLSAKLRKLDAVDVMMADLDESVRIVRDKNGAFQEARFKNKVNGHDVSGMIYKSGEDDSYHWQWTLNRFFTKQEGIPKKTRDEIKKVAAQQLERATRTPMRRKVLGIDSINWISTHKKQDKKMYPGLARYIARKTKGKNKSKPKIGEYKIQFPENLNEWGLPDKPKGAGGVKSLGLLPKTSSVNSPRFVTRVDHNKLDTNPHKLKTYGMSNDGSSSGTDEPKRRIKSIRRPGHKQIKGLFATTTRNSARFSISRNTSWITDPRGNKIRTDRDVNRKTPVSVNTFDAKKFHTLPSGEMLSRNPGKPLHTARSTTGQVLKKEGYRLKTLSKPRFAGLLARAQKMGSNHWSELADDVNVSSSLHDYLLSESWKVEKTGTEKNLYDYYTHPQYNHVKDMHGVTVETKLHKLPSHHYDYDKYPPNKSIWELGFRIGKSGTSPVYVDKHDYQREFEGPNTHQGLQIYKHVLDKAHQFIRHGKPDVLRMVSARNDTEPLYRAIAQKLAHKYKAKHVDHDFIQYIEFDWKKR